MKTLTKREIEGLRSELDKLHQEIKGQLGQEDLDYLVAIKTISNYLEISGRLLIHFSLDPVTWGLGVFNLGLHFIIDNTELGHNILHGQYNSLKDPRFNSSTYKWDIVIEEKQWRRTHNGLHHVFTNIVGKDPDLTYSTFRYYDQIKWRPFYLIQPLIAAISYFNFDYAIALHMAGLLEVGKDKDERPILGDKNIKDLIGEGVRFLSKATPKFFKDFIFYPSLGGIFAPKIVLGNYLATVMRNVYVAVVIYCGHFTERSVAFTQDQTKGEGKGDRYLRQILASGNFEAGKIFSVLNGGLNYQIEHHLFPDIPAWRYKQASERVRDICQRYKIPYNTGSFLSQYKGVLKRIIKYSFPETKKAKVKGAKIIPMKRVA